MTPQEPPSNTEYIHWSEDELQSAVLQILLDARQKKPKSGGASNKLIIDVLGLNPTDPMLSLVLDQMLKEELIEKGERIYQITVPGLDRLAEILKGPNSFLTKKFLLVLNRIATTGKATARELVDFRQDLSIEELELALWYYTNKGYVKSVEREFILTDAGLQFLNSI